MKIREVGTSRMGLPRTPYLAETPRAVRKQAEMAYMQCLECGRLSKQSRCREHRTRQARGYDRHHDRIRQDRIQRNPVCEDCGHVAIHMNHSCNRQEACDRCPLELHHVTPLAQHRYQMPEDRDYLILCRKCHRERTRLGEFD